jgi:hypothetical protein
MTTPANRFVVGPNSQGRSAVLQQGLTSAPCLLIGTMTDPIPVE